MTGFGRGTHQGLYKKTVVEIKTVNSRYADIRVRLPSPQPLLEEKIRQAVSQYFARGYIEVFVKLKDTGAQRILPQVDKDLALAYYKLLKEIAACTDTSSQIEAIQLVQLPEVVTFQEVEIDQLWPDIEPALAEAVEAALAMRKKEGLLLKHDLSERLKIICELHRKIKQRAPLVVKNQHLKLKERLKEFQLGEEIDKDRLMLEIALFADKCNLTEELVRLESHFHQLENSLSAVEPIGRRLDFLLQEINREINTIGSKANDSEIAHHVVALKSELEKIREQVQNIE